MKKSGKNIEALLKHDNVDELMKVDEEGIFITTIEIERKEKLFNELKTRLFENLGEFDQHVSSLLNSTKKGFHERLYENIFNYVVFHPLLNKIHDRKQSKSYVGSLVGSGLRTIGAGLRGGTNPPEFKSLKQAMEHYDSCGAVTKMSKKSGDLLRNVGEKMSGERPTLYRVIKRTVMGLNPFLKQLPHEMKSQVKNKQHLIGIAHALLRVYNGGTQSGYHFIQYLYRYVLPVYGTSVNDKTVQSFYKRIWISAVGKFYIQNHPNETDERVFVDNCIRKQADFEDMFKDSFFKNLSLRKKKVSESSETEKVFILVYRTSKLFELRLKRRHQKTISMRMEIAEREDILRREKEEEEKLIEMNRMLEEDSEEEEEDEGEELLGDEKMDTPFLDEDRMNLLSSVHEDQSAKKGEEKKTEHEVEEEEKRSPMSEELRKHERLTFQRREKSRRKNRRKRVRKNKRMSILDLLREEEEELYNDDEIFVDFDDL